MSIFLNFILPGVYKNSIEIAHERNYPLNKEIKKSYKSCINYLFGDKYKELNNDKAWSAFELRCRRVFAKWGCYPQYFTANIARYGLGLPVIFVIPKERKLDFPFKVVDLRKAETTSDSILGALSKGRSIVVETLPIDLVIEAYSDISAMKDKVVGSVREGVEGVRRKTKLPPFEYRNIDDPAFSWFNALIPIFTTQASVVGEILRAPDFYEGTRQCNVEVFEPALLTNHETHFAFSQCESDISKWLAYGIRFVRTGKIKGQIISKGPFNKTFQTRIGDQSAKDVQNFMSRFHPSLFGEIVLDFTLPMIWHISSGDENEQGVLLNDFVRENKASFDPTIYSHSVIVGDKGSGKSTLMRDLQAEYPHSTCFDSDLLGQFIHALPAQFFDPKLRDIHHNVGELYEIFKMVHLSDDAPSYFDLYAEDLVAEHMPIRLNGAQRAEKFERVITMFCAEYERWALSESWVPKVLMQCIRRYNNEVNGNKGPIFQFTHTSLETVPHEIVTRRVYLQSFYNPTCAMYGRLRPGLVTDASLQYLSQVVISICYRRTNLRLQNAVSSLQFRYIFGLPMEFVPTGDEVLVKDVLSWWNGIVNC
jgi:hypothetical protein